MSLEDAIKYQPDKPTYAIRILSSWNNNVEESLLYKGNLINSLFYRVIVEYIFDDNDNFYKSRPISINEKIADKIIRDFEKYKDYAEVLLVHCNRGKNRSPAVAIALNEIFELGHNTNELKDKYQESNWYVYRMLLESAQKLNPS